MNLISLWRLNKSREEKRGRNIMYYVVRMDVI